MKAVKHSLTIGIGAVLLAGASLGAVADDSSADTRELERRVQRLENILDSDQLIELMERIDDIEQQLRQMRGTLEEQGHRLEQLQARQRNLYSDLDERMREIEMAQDRQQEKPETHEDVEEASAEPAEDAEGSEREAYEEAFNTLRQGRYAAAADAFSAFLEEHGDSEYASNARYWLGESHYVNREFETALEHFRGVVEAYPESNKVPDARLKIGYTQYELGNLEAARETLRAVSEDYGDRSVGRLAEERLVRIQEEMEASGEAAEDEGN